MTKIASAFGTVLIASASFAGVALADNGDYYEGLGRNSTVTRAAPITAPSRVDRFSTGSITNSRTYSTGIDSRQSSGNPQAPPERGDYYPGIVRPE
ncbi:hypothetical protein J2046_001996 [Rhizobium petrolearium]|uniref:hypothetical protein n=1 Tax=Neorhizobium petrolearium TaxID=515361 RepID=UPI001AE3A0B4|nr:hypothetical protein [Neorhizobium petrolearium]MBP1843740.1 hypothetical protein [Neorhizobium petrolearium]